MKVGDKVVCIYDFKKCNKFYNENVPIKGGIYTIREFTHFTQLGIRLVEIRNSIFQYNVGHNEITFLLKCFRSVDYSIGEQVCEEIEKLFIQEPILI